MDLSVENRVWRLKEDEARTTTDRTTNIFGGGPAFFDAGLVDTEPYWIAQRCAPGCGL